MLAVPLLLLFLLFLLIEVISVQFILGARMHLLWQEWFENKTANRMLERINLEADSVYTGGQLEALFISVVSCLL